MKSKRELSDRAKRLRTLVDEAAEHDPRLKLEQRRARAAFAFADELRRAREEQGLTQAELAERMGVSQSFVARLENPRSDKKPGMDTMAKAANALGFDVAIQFVPEHSDEQVAESKPATAQSGAPRTSETIDELLEALRHEIATKGAKDRSVWESYLNRTLANILSDEPANAEAFLANQICSFLTVQPSIHRKRTNVRARGVWDSVSHGRDRIFCGVLNENGMLELPTGVKYDRQDAALYTILGGGSARQSKKKI